ncbi:PspC domain-containing protein [Actinomadura roseirufa]|uniref:PspC domain-containing protein n=1 Tax=Actinomadura roseirufa TaxID=2094049 RepID=UPI0013F1550D|nr:PspC domain-containing protein [Actinomadura roseirufa]
MGEEQNATTGPREPAYRRLARDPERRVVAGVCTGLGRHTGIDPVVYRVGFAVLTLAHGQGIILYIAAALLMPAHPARWSPAEQLCRRWFDAQAVLTILGALLCLGVIGSLFGRMSTDTITIVVVFGLVLLVSYARGVNLVAAARGVPERLAGHRPSPDGPQWAGSAGEPRRRRTDGGLPEGMVDLATYGSRANAPSATLSTAPGETAVPTEIGATAAGVTSGIVSGVASGIAETDTGRADTEQADTAGTDAAWTGGRPAAAGPGASAAYPAARPERRRPASPAASITLLAAMAAGAAMIPVARSHPAPDSLMLVMAPALAVIGLGLVTGGWLRTRGLATAGTVLTLALLTTSVAAEAPRGAEYGEVEWRPTDAGRSFQEYKVGVGQGTLDLTALPLRPGQRITVHAEVMLGGMSVTAPATARIVLDARVLLGDLQVGPKTTSGPNAKALEVLEPETTTSPNPPEIVLRIRGKVGDVEVARA